MAENISQPPSVHVSDFEPVDPAVIALLPAGLVKAQMIVPLRKNGNTLIVAVSKTEGVVKPEGLRMITGCSVEFVLAPAAEIIDFIKRHYGEAQTLKIIPVPPEAIVRLTQEEKSSVFSSPPSDQTETISLEKSSGQVSESVEPSQLDATPIEFETTDKVRDITGEPELDIEEEDKNETESAEGSPTVLKKVEGDITSDDFGIDETTELDTDSAALYALDPEDKEAESIELPKLISKPLESISIQNESALGVMKELPPRDLNLSHEFVKLITDAVINLAAEVWLTFRGDQFQIRYRIRGTFVPIDIGMPSLYPAQGEKLISWVKEWGDRHTSADISWAELRKEMALGEELYSAHCFLTETKESRVLTIRIHSQKEAVFSPSVWGMDPSQIKSFTECLDRKEGFLLFTGSESCGISQNLYACTKHLTNSKRHVISVEPRMECWLPGVEQYFSQGTPHLFNELLRILFKHSPDVVMVSPLESKENYEVCLSESIKGRLVLGRSYALDCADALVQLGTMGVEPYLINSALLGIVTKSSLRLNCPVCVTKDPIGRSQARDMGIPDAMQPSFFYVSKGCDSCHHTGFSGETDIYELLMMTAELRNIFSKNLKVEEIRSHIKSSGLLTLRQVAIHKAINGQTSLAEVIRTTIK